MSDIVNLSSVSERKGKLNKLYENLEELKNQFSEIIDEYEGGTGRCVPMN